MQNDSAKFKIEFQKRLIAFSLNIIRLCNDIRKDRNLWSIADQLIRAATSIGANITEAKGSSSTRDYLKFFEIALKSANETIYWLILVRESYPALESKVEMLLKEADEITRIISQAVITMKGKRNY